MATKKSIVLILSLLGIYTGCSNVNPSIHKLPVPVQEQYDFSVGNLQMPDSAVFARSIISPGRQSRLLAFFEKISLAGPTDTIRIGCIGGSITAGASAQIGYSYAPRFVASLGKMFPDINFSLVNAGIGATTSRFGASRIFEDLLEYSPDLVIIEYAVNDDPSDSVNSCESFEGILRQSLQHEAIPIIVLQTLNISGDSINHIRQQIIANHYSIPVISYRNAVWPEVASGNVPWSSLSADAVHPNDTGHLIISVLLANFIEQSALNADTISDVSDPCPTPLFSDLFEYAKLYEEYTGEPILEQSVIGWTKTSDAIGRSAYSSTDSNAVLSLVSNVQELSIMFHYRLGNESMVEVKVDGVIVDTLSNYFAADWGGGYMKPYQVFKQIVASSHLVTLRTLNRIPFDVKYVLYASKPLAL